MTWLRDMFGRRRSVPWVLALLFALVYVLPARAATPATLAYQGYLTSAAGAPINSSVSMTFSLYAALTGGSPVWQETQNVQVSNGVYAVTLGAVNAVNLPFDVPYYLGISVGADAEMTPRQALASTPYAFTARSATSTVVDGNGNLAPTGYVKLGGAGASCSGATAGALRWNGSRFEGCDGTGWTPFASATCADSIRNGGETDVDCGGSCVNKCAVGKTCNTGSDCSSGSCGGGVCLFVATCTDSMKNGTETDIDCGGTCPKCASGKQCLAAADCASGICNGGVCAVASCSDGVKNGDETDVDCGGSCANSCSAGKACLTSADCAGVANGRMACVGNVCSTTVACNAGFSDCDNNAANGCEINVMSSSMNCGACGNSCPGVFSVCSSGVCN